MAFNAKFWPAFVQSYYWSSATLVALTAFSTVGIKYKANVVVEPPCGTTQDDVDGRSGRHATLVIGIGAFSGYTTGRTMFKPEADLGLI